MAKTRQKKELITDLITREDAEQLFAEYAAADARQQRIQATMDIQITKIREKYQDDLASLTDEKNGLFEKLQHFAQSSPELFTKKKSLETSHGVLGFRTGNPALKPIKGYTWASVLNLIKALAPDYVRTKEEVDKESLLADREKEGMQVLMPKLGVSVEQSEAFFVECKKEQLASVN